jgi:hypothetical protein
MRGQLSVSADEMPYEHIEVNGWDGWDPAWVGYPPRGRRRLLAELRSGLQDIEPLVDRLEYSRIETCSTARMHEVAEPAMLWAQRTAILAVSRDESIAVRDLDEIQNAPVQRKARQGFPLLLPIVPRRAEPATPRRKR